MDSDETIRHRLKLIDDLRATLDGSFATMTLHTETAPPLAIEIPAADLADVAASVLQLGRAMQAAGSPVIPLQGAKLELQVLPNGTPMLVARAGSIGLGFELDPRLLAPLGRTLLTLSAQPPKRRN